MSSTSQDHNNRVNSTNNNVLEYNADRDEYSINGFKKMPQIVLPKIPAQQRRQFMLKMYEDLISYREL